MLGILLINKPIGITSHDAVNRVRRRLGVKRVGHAGTLDPLAEGLLVMAVGPATRFLQYLSLEPKVYEAVYAFGEATPTYDAETAGEGETKPLPEPLDNLIADALPRYLGAIQQLPPIYSAVKKDGKALYKYARAGEDVERTMREVFIDAYEPLGGEGGQRSFRIVCSGGTYIRTLAHDLGADLGCGAHLAGLVRTQVGRFHLPEAAELDDEDLACQIIPLAEALPPMPIVQVEPSEMDRVRNGNAIPIRREIPGRFVALADSDGAVFAAARVGEDHLQPECVIPPEALSR
jgi:tRNA pseudouridine55 synthase